jgi:hypothetical protein
VVVLVERWRRKGGVSANSVAEARWFWKCCVPRNAVLPRTLCCQERCVAKNTVVPGVREFDNERWPTDIGSVARRR